MQYILTQEELDALVDIEKYRTANDAITVARQIILKQANYTCIYDRTGYDDYCIGCPLAGHHDDDFGDWKTMKLLCGHDRNFPK